MLQKQHYYFLIALLLIFAALAILLFVNFLAPLVIGALLAALGSRWYKRVLHLFKNRDSLAAFIVVSIMIILIVIPAILFVIFVANEAFNLFVAAQEGLNIAQKVSQIEAVLSKININVDIGSLAKNQLFPAMQNFGLFLSQQIGGLLSNAAYFLIGLLIVFITTFYLLKDGHRLGEFLIKVSPLKTADELFVFKTFKDVSGALFYGNFLIALIQGALGGLGFWIFGFSSPILWGLVIGLLALIPLLGASLVYVPAAIYLFIVGNPTLAIVFLIYNIIYVLITENILKPKFISERMKVHPLLVLLSILGGIQVFGILGVIYGPLIITVFLGLLNVYVESQRGEVLVK